MPRRAEIALAAFLVLALAIAIGAGLRHPAQQSVLDQRPSTLLAGPTGSRGVYEVLATLRRRVSRRRTPLFDLMTGDARRPAMLVVIAPEGQLQEAELASVVQFLRAGDRKSTRLNSSHPSISYAVFCLKKKKPN